jgi:membrane fusion protein (multidrug efflux system)
MQLSTKTSARLGYGWLARNLTVSLALLGLLLFSACSDSGGATAGHGPRTLKVETAVVTSRNLENRVSAVGSLAATAKVAIRPQVDGIVQEFNFTEGERVDQGQLLAKLDDSKAQAKLEFATAQLDSAKAKRQVSKQRYERYGKLISEDLVSKEKYQDLQAEYRAAEAAVRESEAQERLAQRELEDFSIRAPFTGTIGMRLIHVGNYVERGDVLTTIMNDDPIEVQMTAPDRYSRNLKAGMEVLVRDFVTGDDFPGELSYIAPDITERTRMRVLKALAPNPEGKLRPGQFVEIDLVLADKPNTITVPEEAVVSMAGDTWVYIVNSDVAERRRVKLGLRFPGEVEVIEGVEVGEEIVVIGQHRLTDGASTQASDADEIGARTAGN